MFGFWAKIKKLFTEKYEQYVVEPRIDKALQDLRDIIEKEGGDKSIDRVTKANEPRILKAAARLANYPDLLEKRGLGYLQYFAKNPKPIIADGEKIPTSLSSLIAYSIPLDIKNELLIEGNFKPLASSARPVTTTIPNQINIMFTGKNGEDRCVNGTIAFFERSGKTEAEARKMTDRLIEISPLLCASISQNLETVAKQDASFVIVAPRAGFDLAAYRNEVVFTTKVQQELTEMAKSGLNEDRLIALNQEARTIRKDNISVLKGEEKLRGDATQGRQPVVDIAIKNATIGKEGVTSPSSPRSVTVQEGKVR